VVKVPIDNIIFAIKMIVCMLSIQDIHDHFAKYTTIPESWCCKNYAYDFVECIKSVIEKQQVLDELHTS
jgi:hypothetical protein